MQRLPSRLLSLVLLLTAGLLAGCDSGGPDLDAETGPTVAFANASLAVTEQDSTVTLDVVLSNPDGQAVSVEILYADAASTTDTTDFGLQPSAGSLTTYGDGQAYVVEQVTFPAGAESGAAQQVTFEIASDDGIEEREVGVFALQNVQTQGRAAIGETRTINLSIGFPTLAEVKAGSDLGDAVTTQGTVIRIDGDTVYLQDESGGLAVFDGAVAGEVSVGDKIIVSGIVDVFAGLLEIADVGAEGFTVVSSDNPLPEPQTVTLTEIAENGEAYVSTLVRVEGLTFEDAGGTFEGGTNYTISDGSGGEVTLRVTDGSFYVGQPIPGDEVTFTGVVGQFNGNFGSILPNSGYQLLALLEGDLQGGDTGGDTGGGGGDGDSTNVIPIAEARAVDDGGEVTVEGIITRSTGSNTYIQDASGPTGASGIIVFQFDGAFVSALADGTLGVGDSVRVTGTKTTYNGLEEIEPTGYERLFDGDVSNLPTPQTPSLSELSSNGEAYEAELVRIEGLEIVPDGGDDDSDPDGTFKAGGAEGNYTVTGPDGNTLTLRIPSGSFYEDQPIPDAAVTFVGPVGEFNGSYQLTAIDEGDATAQ